MKQELKRTFKVLQNVNIFEKKQNYVKLETEGHEPVFIQIGEKNYELLKAQEDGAKKEVQISGKV